jgi:hypothetical protein
MAGKCILAHLQGWRGLNSEPLQQIEHNSTILKSALVENMCHGKEKGKNGKRGAVTAFRAVLSMILSS